MRSLDEGNRLFSAKKYEEAGQCYAALARENRLPADRINHWAYCRMVAVATRMNARPQSDREWTEIEAEIQSIQRLAPRLWYAEYLRNRLAEARKSRSRTPAKSDNLVVRGSAPDEDSGESRRLPRLFGKSRADAPPNRSDTESQVASDVADSKVEGATAGETCGRSSRRSLLTGRARGSRPQRWNSCCRSERGRSCSRLERSCTRRSIAIALGRPLEWGVAGARDPEFFDLSC